MLTRMSTVPKAAAAASMTAVTAAGRAGKMSRYEIVCRPARYV